ncbi:orotate phosphoribosyltransferase [Gracilinema caldarium]|uniref:orotate phosphoribosyltransferase n=1 Tax=Gracilinema caldarium TaxID=215591 RepID=UPI0026F1892C|nr:orotate phosphoribosyltransferase [Gracilinema caldarium]
MNNSEHTNRTLELLRQSGAMLEGHFLLSSGRHSDRYFQCARLLQYPDRAAEALSAVAAAIKADVAAGRLAVDMVVGPAMGGIIVAYELARQLGLPALFTERDDTGAMTLRRGFEIAAGQRILIAEDVVTTGKSSEESAAVLEALGGKVVALACVVDRRAQGVQVRWPLYPACTVSVANWDAGDCDLCKQNIPYVKPGSRKFATN